MSLLASLLLLVGHHSEPPLALVFSTEPLPHEAALREQGWEVRHVAMPCDNNLYCWANKAGQISSFRKQVQASIRGRKNVMLVGVSRGGYLALGMADLPEVSRIAAIAPMTEPNRPGVFSGPLAVKLDPSLIAGKRVFIEVGNSDETVDTYAALRYAYAAMNPKLTLWVNTLHGHDRSDPHAMIEWLRREKL